MQAIAQNVVTEWSFASKTHYADPFNDVDLTVSFTDQAGAEMLVPAFWAGSNIWRVRFSAPAVGRYRYRTVCTDTENPDLHSCEGEFEVVPYVGDNPLFQRGHVRVADGHRHFEHADGTPFFWLADTWWMGLCNRVSWPREFQTLTMDRVDKGFSVVQIVVGPYPDMPAFDPRGANETGFPWQNDWTAVRPEYFDYADRRIDYLVESGLVPCIVGSWGYHLRTAGVETMRKHWRYLIARYSAYPVFWCVAGEATMPYYLSQTKDEDSRIQKQGWTELTRFVRGTDPCHHPITIHPVSEGRDSVDDPSVLDFEMLQTGHGDRASIPPTVSTVIKARNREPVMPVVEAEVCYEGIGEACRQEVQRALFWMCMLSGASGFTYGANGLWQFNTLRKPYGPSPHGLSWGGPPWDEASQLPGSHQLGLSKRLLERFPWWRMEPHPEWIEPHWTEENYVGPYAAGIPGELRVIFFPLSWWGAGVVKGIEPDADYDAFLFNPVSGDQTELGRVVPDENGDWPVRPLGPDAWALMPVYQDWILVLSRKRG